MTHRPHFLITIHLYGVTASNCPDEIFDTVGEAKDAAFEECDDAAIQLGRDAFGIPLRITCAPVFTRPHVMPWCPLPYRPEHHSPIVVR